MNWYTHPPVQDKIYIKFTIATFESLVNEEESSLFIHQDCLPTYTLQLIHRKYPRMGSYPQVGCSATKSFIILMVLFSSTQICLTKSYTYDFTYYRIDV